MILGNILNCSNWEQKTQERFKDELAKKFPELQQKFKWKQNMFQYNDTLVVCLVFGKKQLKFCFFNNPDIKLNKLQRWSQTIYSQNLEIQNSATIDWNYINKLIGLTIQVNQ